MKYLLSFILLFSLVAYGQYCSYDKTSHNASELCDLYRGNNFSSDLEADKAVNRILSTIGASKRFVLHSCDEIDNCTAVSFKGIRYILYDKSFLQEISQNTNSWSKLSILAHEIGHHINGHSVDIIVYGSGAIEPPSLSESRKMELEADEFSGFVMAKLGATLSQAQQAIKYYGFDGDDSFSTHPSRDKRLNAIKKGYVNAGRSVNVYATNSSSMTAEDYFYRGRAKEKLQDYRGAISDYNKAIKLDPKNASSYGNRGSAKFYLQDYRGAISDCNKAIELDPKYAKAYYNRGSEKEILQDYRGAISDYTKVIELYPKFADAYNNRGLAKNNLQDYRGAISDYSKAIELNPKYVLAYNNRGIAKNNLQDYRGAISDYSKAIELDPKYAFAYNNRGLAKIDLGQKDSGCLDFSKAGELGLDQAYEAIKNFCNN